jgi:hypothetical protein
MQYCTNIKRTLLLQLHYRILLITQVTVEELVLRQPLQISYCFIQQLTHTARAIRPAPNEQNKTEREGEYLPPLCKEYL